MSFKAFIAGVSVYQDKRISNLPFVKADIDLFRETLKQHMLIEPDDIFVVGDNPKKSGWKDISNGLKSFISGSQEDDTLLVYFSGHGASIDGKGYLICHDTDVNFINKTSLSIDEFTNNLKVTDAKNKIVFLDSCYSGVNLGKSTGSEMVIEGISNLTSEGWSILASCKAHELSFGMTDNSGSVFTHFLCEAIKGKALGKDTDILSLADINKYVHNQVTRYTINNCNASQTPTLQTERTNELEFKVKVVEITPEMDLVDDESIPKYVRSIDFSYSYYAPKTSHAYDYNKMVNVSKDISDKDRRSAVEHQRKKSIKDVNTTFLNFFNPSELNKPNRNRYVYPLGEMSVDNSEFGTKITLTITDFSHEKCDEVLKLFDDQDRIKWDKISFYTTHQVDFDNVKKICIENDYQISEFDLDENTISLVIFQEGLSNLLLDIEQFETESQFTFHEQYGLRKEFYESLPLYSFIEKFLG